MEEGRMRILGRGGYCRLSYLAGVWLVVILALTCVRLPVARGAAATEPHASSASGPISSTLANEQLRTVACPSVAQCTAVDTTGNALTFNPSAPGQPTRVPIAPGTDLRSIACPSVSQCTILAGANEETFDPQTSAPPTVHAVQGDSNVTDNPADDAGPTAIACPTVDQCTELASDADAFQYTFDPDAFTTPTPAKIDANTSDGATAIACPSTSQCTVVDTSGQEVSFNPTNPGDPSPVAVDHPAPIPGGGGALNTNGGSLSGVACPSLTQCTAVDSGGQEVTFDPSNPGTPTPVYNLAPASDVACPSISVCVADGSQEKEFNPASPNTTTQAVSGGASGIGCPSTAQCTGVAGSPSDPTASVIVTFNPTTGTPETDPGTGAPGGSPKTGGPGSAKRMGVASLIRARVSGENITVTLSCPSGASCHAVRLSLTAHEVFKHGKLTAVSAGRPSAKTKTKTITVARATASFAKSARSTVTLRGDGTARRLLSRFRQLKVRLSLTTTTAKGLSVRPASRVLTLRAPRRR
jgi:hypothetical protein